QGQEVCIAPPEISFKDDEYANLNARAFSPEAGGLIVALYEAVSHWELQTRSRSYERRHATAPKFKGTLERLVGDLLLAKADKEGNGRLYLSMDKNGFKGDRMPISYRNLMDAQEALRSLGLIEVIPGQGRFREVTWGRNDTQKWQLKGWATRFNA